MKRLTVAIVAVLLAVACMNNGIEWSELSYTRHRPADQDMVGTWVLTEKSMKKIVKVRGYVPPPPRFDLRPDGTGTVTNFPHWYWDADSEVHFRLVSGEGRWRIDKEKDVYTIYVLELELQDAVEQVNISKQKAPYQFHVTLGDPDSGNYLLFQKTP